MSSSLLLAGLLLLVPYIYSLYRKLHHKRYKQYASIPQLPNHLLLGHLKHMGEFMKLAPPDAHPDLIFSKMRDSIGRPPLMLVDLRPVNKPMILIADHEILEQISKATKKYPASVPKIDFGHFRPLIGDTSVLAVDYDQWKPLRQRFSPGFAPQHLLTLLPAILEKTTEFTDILDGYAKSGEAFALMSPIMNLTFDVIGAVAMGVDLNSQSKDHQGELIQLFNKLLSTYLNDKADLPWWLVPHVSIRRQIYGKRIDSILNAIIRTKWASFKKEQGESADKKKDKSILALSFHEYANRRDELTQSEITSTRDQLKTFLLAGHDTTSTAFCWILYELSRTPRALKAVRKELDSVFGPDPNLNTITSVLLASTVTTGQPNPINQMTYTSAVIKETLRLHPPTGSARTSPPGDNFSVRTQDGAEYCLDGAIIYMCNRLAQRDEKVYGRDANEFKPERWLPTETAKDVVFPASAWRPFERGPRGCIGQEFALIEIKTILALVVRRYEFCKVGLGEVVAGDDVGEDGQLRVKSELYVTRQITSKPVDGMRMRVKFASKS
ncbi:cytochrome P450 [Cladorrhinum sp. PSN332]|nr:cytochrome P450 [Cladorrhinum sp. PSN332]